MLGKLEKELLLKKNVRKVQVKDETRKKQAVKGTVYNALSPRRKLTYDSQQCMLIAHFTGWKTL